MLAHYRIETPLGSGAMGTVYLAHDTSLERSVAVKVLHHEIAEEPEIVQRFEREARAAARVNHPNLTHVYFVGNEAERRFFVMEYVPGESLFDHVESSGPLELEKAIDVLIQAARGLGAAQAAGVIHRDVKPSNLMLLPDGTVKVTDFGLAKSLTGEVDATGAGRIMGTPRYMSPEQCQGETVDARADTYGLGLVGYYLLTGDHAYDGPSLGKVINDQINKPLPDVTDKRSDVGPAVDDVLQNLTAKKPDDRPQTMSDVTALLETVRPRELDLAALATRVAALLADIVIVFIAFVAVFAVISFLSKWLGFMVGGAVVNWVGTAVQVAFMALLFICMEWKYGGSPGKLMFHLRVVDENGARPGWLALTLRFLLRFPVAAELVNPALGLVTGILFGLQMLALATGFVCYFALQRRTMSDVLTRTRVVTKRSVATRRP
jgi:uncharacterized RDD family membrane protein YckC/predicted Ser/Thr protein kinase